MNYERRRYLHLYLLELMGKHKYIESPEKMWELFDKYRKATKNNPIKKHVFVGKDGNSDYEMRERPLTMEGFENYVAEQGLNQDLSHYFANHQNRYENYLAICSRIRKCIRQDQIEGGMASIYNPSITQRLNNLTDRQDITSKGEQVKLPEWMTTKK